MSKYRVATFLNNLQSLFEKLVSPPPPPKKKPKNFKNSLVGSKNIFLLSSSNFLIFCFNFLKKAQSSSWQNKKLRKLLCRAWTIRLIWKGFVYFVLRALPGYEFQAWGGLGLKCTWLSGSEFIKLEAQ